MPTPNPTTARTTGERTDSDRLDFMALSGAMFNYSQTMSITLGAGGELAGGSMHEGGMRVGLSVPRHDDYGNRVYDAPTIRECIDMAMDDAETRANANHFPRNHSCLRRGPA